MTLLTIGTGADTAPSLAATRGSTVDEWAAFYGLVNDYEEPARVSAADVLAVRDRVASVLEAPLSQLEYDTDGLSGLVEGRSFRVGISAGIISCRSTDLSGREHTLDEAPAKRSRNIDMLQVDPETGEILDSDGPSRAEITEWSYKSRAQMTRSLASLDYSDWCRADGSLAMVTTTLPGDWKPIAPDGRTFKKLVRKFEHRFRRAVGPWRLLWKLEFQRRGAPHFHALMRIPAMVEADGGYGKGYGPNEKNGWAGIPETFESWLSRTWADVCGASREIDTIGRWVPVGAPVPVLGFDGVPLRDRNGDVVTTSAGYEIDELDGEQKSEYSRHLNSGIGIDFSGKDFSDPRRISMYFAGHSAKSQDGKEYQNLVPALWRRPGSGPGRFWGFAGLDNATVELEVTQKDFDRLRRELRKLARARAWTIAVKRARGAAVRSGCEPPHILKVRAPKVRKSNLGGRGGQNGGWVLLNDALTVVRQLSSWLEAPNNGSWDGLVEPSAVGIEKRAIATDAGTRFWWDLAFTRACA